jgi:hypothetical protein
MLAVGMLFVERGVTVSKTGMLYLNQVEWQT